MTLAQLIRWLIEIHFANPVTEAIARFETIFGQIADQLRTNNQTINRVREAIMAKIDDLAKSTGEQFDAIKEQNRKALAEIKAKFDELSEVQITPEELEAAKAAAKQAGRLENQAEMEAAMDAAFAPVQQKATDAKATSQELDDLVTDAQTPPQNPPEAGREGDTENGGPSTLPTV